MAIRVSEQGSPQLVDELLAGTLDLALAIAPVQSRGVASVALAEEELVVVTTPDHPLARRRSVTVPELAEYPLVMFRPGYDLRTSTLASFAEHGLEPVVAVEGGEMGSVLALVAAGLGAAVVPGIVTTGETRLRVTRFRRPAPTRTIALVSRRRPGPLARRRCAGHHLHRGDHGRRLAGTDAPGNAAPPLIGRSRPTSRPDRPASSTGVHTGCRRRVPLPAPNRPRRLAS